MTREYVGGRRIRMWYFATDTISHHGIVHIEDGGPTVVTPFSQ